MEKELIASFNKLKVNWKDDINKSRVLDTIIFIHNRITLKLGAAALNDRLLVGQVGDNLLVPIRVFYAPIPHTREYKDVKSLVLGCLKTRFNMPLLADAERRAKDEIIIAATRYFNRWRIQAIEEVIITKKRASAEEPRPLTGYLKTDDIFVGLSKDEVLALQTPMALEILSEDPSKKDFLESKGFDLSETKTSKFQDESSNGFNETSMISEKYPTLAWFLYRAGFDGISKAYSNASAKGVPDSEIDSIVRSSLRDNIKKNGADSILQQALEKAAASE